MPSIHIKNIGPISDSGIIELTPVILLIGKQSTGKSTFMKILSYCCWLEKRIMVDGEELVQKYTHYGRFTRELKGFHRLSDTFFSNSSEIHFEGECVSIELIGVRGNARITRKPNYADQRHNTKLCFIPSERNMVSAIQNINKAYKSSSYDALYNYLWEFDEAKGSYVKDNPLEMPFDSAIAYYYDERSDKDMIILRQQGKSIETFYASSGVQSALPIAVMVDYLNNIVGSTRKLSPKDITNAIARAVLDKDKSIGDLSGVDLSKITQLLQYKNVQLFIEEPEQNLFPESQFALVSSIVKAIKNATIRTGVDSRVVMTTHSPYVLTSLNLLMKAVVALEKSPEKTASLLQTDGLLPLNYYSAYWISMEGKMENIIDEAYGFIMGDKLDEISEMMSEKTELLNDIIYGDTV